MSTAAPQVGFGQVRHTRLHPHRHAFAYPTYFLMLPMRRLRAAPHAALARNRFGLRGRQVFKPIGEAVEVDRRVTCGEGRFVHRSAVNAHLVDAPFEAVAGFAAERGADARVVR